MHTSLYRTHSYSWSPCLAFATAFLYFLTYPILLLHESVLELIFLEFCYKSKPMVVTVLLICTLLIGGLAEPCPLLALIYNKIPKILAVKLIHVTIH